MSVRSEIKVVFTKIANAELAEDVLEVLYQLSVEFAIQPKELGNKWESFAVNRQLNIFPSIGNLTAFKQELNEKHKTSGVVKKKKDSDVIDKASLPKAPFASLDLGEMLGEYGASDSTQLFQEAMKKRQEEQAEEEKKKKLLAAEASRAQRLRAEEPMSSSPVKPSNQAVMKSKYDARTTRGKINVEKSTLVEYTRCMNNNFDAMSGYLESRLKHMGEAALADNKLVPEGLLERPSQEPIISFARICSELDETVTAESFLIEGAAHGVKPRMPLDLTELESYSIFPGQIAAVRGINNGKRFIASHLLPPHPLPHRPPPTDGLSLLVAAGPFSFASATSYEMLRDLLDLVTATRPSAVVLHRQLGPFVNVQHPDIQKPVSLHLTFEELFDSEVDRIAEVAKNTKTHFFLVPSTRDVHHVFPYPQPPFTASTASEYVHMLSNPSTFLLAGLVIGVSTADVFSPMLHREKNKQPASSSQQAADRFTRVCEHVLQQRSYYPIFPTFLGDTGNDAGFADISLMKHAEMAESPHILITPSHTLPGIKVVNNTLCVNPGFVGGELGGNYASIVVHPKEGASAGSASSTLMERIRAELVHI